MSSSAVPDESDSMDIGWPDQAGRVSTVEIAMRVIEVLGGKRIQIVVCPFSKTGMQVYIAQCPGHEELRAFIEELFNDSPVRELLISQGEPFPTTY